MAEEGTGSGATDETTVDDAELDPAETEVEGYKKTSAAEQGSLSNQERDLGKRVVDN